MADDWYDVTEFDGEYEETEVKTGFILDDGPYQATVVESRIEQGRDNDRQWALKFQDRNSGGTVRKWNSFDAEVGRSVIKSDAVVMGYRGDTFSGIAEAIAAGEFDGLVVEIVVKTNPGESRDFKNVYVNRLLEGGERGERQPMPAGGDTNPDDDIPF